MPHLASYCSSLSPDYVIRCNDHVVAGKPGGEEETDRSTHRESVGRTDKMCGLNHLVAEMNKYKRKKVY